MVLDPELLYRQLGQLVADMPDLAGDGVITPAMHTWLGRAAALIAEDGRTDALAAVDRSGFAIASDGLVGIRRGEKAHQIATILYRALAHAELKAPAAVQGAFIPVGGVFDVFRQVSKVLEEAKRDVLIVDPYMDAKVLTDFAPLAAEQVTIRLLDLDVLHVERRP